MRIVYVAPNILLPGFHGGSTHVSEVLRELRRDNDVLLLARRGSHGEGVVGIGGRLAPGMLRYLLPFYHFLPAYAHVRRFKPDLIYDRFSSFGLGVLLGKMLDVPVVSMVLDKSATLITLRGSDRLLGTDRSLLDRRYQHKTHQVWWGANTDTFHPRQDGRQVRKALGIEDGVMVIGYTGGFYDWHDLETVVGAAAKIGIAGRLPRCHFLMIGDGEFRSRIEEMVFRKKLTASFLFPGRIPHDEIPRYVASCDLCLAPYSPAKHKDMQGGELFSYPLKVFEYLAAGKATITIDSANMRQVFRHKEHLMLLEPACPELLADTIMTLMDDAALRSQLGQSGRKLVEERYSWHAHGQHLNEIFSTLIQGPGTCRKNKR